jgi:2-polyprenyl-3-methyl-5-hydroxy-6-metoxy-1,4-benzoquinol methylase
MKTKRQTMKKYNTTDLDPQASFERHVFHRDQFAHYLRWSHILKVATIGDVVVDFGCGKGNMLEVFYRNKYKLKKYTGIDIRKATIESAIEKFKVVDWAKFFVDDLVAPSGSIDYTTFQANTVCSFEVIEHIGKQNAAAFLKNFKACGHYDATYYLSTPNYDQQVGAAGNHTYDSGDGRGVAVQEFEHGELQAEIQKEFDILKKYGTFASVKDYKPRMSLAQLEVYNQLKEYYDSNMMSVIMAPMFPEQSRNTLWVLKQKPQTGEKQ